MKTSDFTPTLKADEMAHRQQYWHLARVSKLVVLHLSCGTSLPVRALVILILRGWPPVRTITYIPFYRTSRI